MGPSHPGATQTAAALGRVLVAHDFESVEFPRLAKARLRTLGGCSDSPPTSLARGFGPTCDSKD